MVERSGPLTVIMPAYNEEAAIEAAVREVRRCVLDAVPDADLVVVDDGSRDSTGLILDRLAAEDPRVRVIHQPNRGHGAALWAGMEAAHGDFLLLMDSDRQIPVEAFQDLWEAAQGRDAALGIRRARQDPALRRHLSSALRLGVRLLFGVRLRDANAPFKVVRRSVWIQARSLMPPGALTPSLFLAVYLACRGLSFVERPVPHRKRATGVVSIRRWRLLRFCLASFRQLLAFRRRLRT